MKKFWIAQSLVALTLLSGCSDEDFIDDPFFNKSESEIFKSGLISFKQRNYRDALSAFESFEALYPLSTKTPYAQKFAIESHYRGHDFMMTKAACDRFLLEHPKDINADYVAYKRFLAEYMLAFHYPANVIPVDRALRECSDLKKLYTDSLDFFNNYPDSPYKITIAKRLPQIRKTISRHEYLKGKYMLDRKQYFGFMQQYGYIKKHFPYTDEEIKIKNLYEKKLDFLFENQVKLTKPSSELEIS